MAYVNGDQILDRHVLVHLIMLMLSAQSHDCVVSLRRNVKFANRVLSAARKSEVLMDKYLK